MGNYYFENDAVAYVLASRKLYHNWDYSHILNDFHIFLRKEYYWSYTVVKQKIDTINK